MSIDIEQLYCDLHANPELSFQEHRTATRIADLLRRLGLTVTTEVAGTGVVGVLEHGPGPVVLLRADMDALPVEELTGFPYASTARGIEPDGTDVPVMHACGHDVHMACLIGAVERLVAARDRWTGTLVALFQPAEERYGGAQAMVDDGLFDRFPRPDVVLAQHVDPLPAGWIGLRGGAAAASANTITITLHGSGGHASRPETTIDPVLMAASTTMRLQGIVSRELAASDAAVVSVSQIHAGTASNIISPEATLSLSVRTFDEGVRSKVLTSIERIVRAEAAASGATREPEFTYDAPYPVTWNDEAATERIASKFRRIFGDACVVDPGADPGSEDVGVIAAAAGAPLVYWLLGGSNPALYGDGYVAGRTPDHVPSNHSPYFAPVMRPTLENGVTAMTGAALEWLRPLDSLARG